MKIRGMNLYRVWDPALAPHYARMFLIGDKSVCTMVGCSPSWVQTLRVNEGPKDIHGWRVKLIGKIDGDLHV